MSEHHHDRQHEPDAPHGHSHAHGADFEWDAMADRLELDAAITEPIVRTVITEIAARVDRPIAHVLDAGCGPGAVTCTLAELLPDASVTAMDSSPDLLERVDRRAAAHGLTGRLTTLAGDLDHDLPALAPVDLVWAGMVLHHVADPLTTLRRLHGALAPGGTLVMTEFGDVPTLLPADDPPLGSGTWVRFQAATTEALNRRLGLDPVAIDWPTLLVSAGFHDVQDSGRTAVHTAPLSSTARAWLEPHVRRGIEMARDLLAARDIAALEAFADTVAHRDDLTVIAARRVLVSRR